MIPSETTHYYGIHAKRGKEATDALGILSHYKGTVVHDFWKSYLQYTCGHAFCNAHIMRELTWAFEQKDQSWANELKTLLLEINKQVEQCKHSKNSLRASLKAQSSHDGKAQRCEKAQFTCGK